ncbi:HNH endonuclease [Streptomyces zaomyceticus]|uniref:HNH endonuclease n=1 Tax=Streptomyces zaomyceticus TaxID=68286 RepID=UPI002E1426B6|nr:HNH endonuclease [Streptomyces zaomyceticus]
MIPLERPKISTAFENRLTTKSKSLAEESADTKKARETWKTARTIRRDLKELLAGMAAGFVRCMYCGDSLGTDIDHFKPIAQDPLSAFIWSNHFLACSHCNSNKKRDQYPCSPSGECLLVDPSKEDPYDHIRLNLPTGKYLGRTDKGNETIRVFGLSRPDLELGRAHAYVRCESMLRDWSAQIGGGREDSAKAVLTALTVQPFADVLYAMIKKSYAPGAASIFHPVVLAALREVRENGKMT